MQGAAQAGDHAVGKEVTQSLNEAGVDRTWETILEDSLPTLGLTRTDIPTAWETAPPNPRTAAPSVYLDHKDWINLAKARVGHPGGEAYRNIYSSLCDLSAAGEIRVVLSASSYMELHRTVPTDRQKTDLAATMGQISHFNTIAPRSVLLEAQVDASLHRHFGRPMFPRKPRVFGRGFHFAFRGTEAALRLSPEGADLLTLRLGEDGFGSWLFQTAEVSEYLVLRGARAQDIPLIPGYVIDPIIEMEAARVRRETELALMLAADPTMKCRLDDLVVARELVHELVTELPRLLGHAGMSLETFFLKPKEWITTFMTGVPSFAVQMALRQKNYANASREWKINDIRDLDHLSTAVVYCDVVVTEKHAASILRNAGLDSRFKTTILKDLRSLAATLSTVGTLPKDPAKIH
jgi:hypothetical protein